MGVLVRSTPLPKPNASAPTTVPTPKRYEPKENGTVYLFCHQNERSSSSRVSPHNAVSPTFPGHAPAGQPTGIATNRVASLDLTRANATRLPRLWTPVSAL